MVIQINYKSGKPVYLQIVEQIKYAAAAGNLKAGDAIPGIRPLAEKLRVNRNTVPRPIRNLNAKASWRHGQARVATSRRIIPR